MSLLTEKFIISPLSVPGCQLWLDGADSSTMTLSGSSVTQWRDKSVNANHFSSAGVGTSPTIGTFNGLRTISWTNTSQQLFSAKNNTTPGNTPRTMFVLQYNPLATSQLYLVTGTESGGNPATAWGFGKNPNADYSYPFLYSSSGADVFTVVQIRDIPTITVATFDGSTISGWINSEYQISKSTTLNTTAGIWYLGKRQQNGTGSVDSYHLEIIQYSTTLTTSDRQKIEGYLAWKWGFQTSLPSTHPFRNYRPLNGVSIPPSLQTAKRIVTNKSVFLPSQISGLQLWLDGTDPNGTGIAPPSGATITSWKDKSSNALMGTALNSPTYQANVVNGLSVIRFNGVNQYINFGNVLNLGTNSLTIFMVTKFAINAGNQVGMVGKASYRGNPGRWAFVYDTVAAGPNGLGIDFFIDDTNQALTGFAYNPGLQFNLFTGVNNRTSSNVLYYNGNFGSQQVISLSTNNLSNTDPLYVAAYPNSTGSAPQTGQYMNGDIAEILVYFSALTTLQRQQVEGYLSWKWGLQRLLPDGHPFKVQAISPFPAITTARIASTKFFNPRNISGLQFWLDAADSSSITNTASGVSQWNDKSNNAYNATQTVSGSRPTYSQRQITFANNAYLDFPQAAINNTTTYALFLVFYPIASVNWIIQKQYNGVGSYNMLSMTNYWQNNTGVTNYLYWGSHANTGVANSSTALSLNTLQLVEVLYSSNTLRILRNGILLSTTTSGPTLTILNILTATNCTIGSWRPDGGIQNSGVTNFRMAEFVYFNTALSASQQQQIEGYLAWKWGLQTSLPASHPFAKFPPSP